MNSTLKLTPAAAGRMYHGPCFHRSRTPAENRRIIRQQIRQLKASVSMDLRYMGCILEAIANFKPASQPA